MESEVIKLRNPGPIYLHDCEGGCEYIGTTRGDCANWFDWYVHPRDDGQHSIICRYSSEGSHYLSYIPETLRQVSNPVGSALYEMWRLSKAAC